MNELSSFLIIAGAVVAALLLAIWLWHFFQRRSGRRELLAFQEQIQKLTDTIDALKRRHNLLHHMDKGFETPMSGETLSSYNVIAERLERFRETTFRFSEVAEQSLALVNAERFLGSGRAREARRQIRGENAAAALSALARECEEPLNRIEQAHALAKADLQAFRQENEKLGNLLNSVVAASLIVTPYNPDREAAAALVEHSQSLLPGDPLGTLKSLGEAREKIAALCRRAANVLEQAGVMKNLAQKVGAIQQAARQRRTEGFLLQEDGANPDPVLVDVQQHLSTIEEALNRADDTAAAATLSKASALTERAHQGLEAHVHAKAKCASELQIRQSDVRRLTDSLSLARAQQAELSREFAAEAWLNVAGNVSQAQTVLETAERCVTEAVQHVATNVQRFVLAGKLLDQATEHHQQAEAKFKALGTRLHELVELRAACQAQLGQLRSRAERVGQMLQSGSTDRVLANERYRAAREALDRLNDECRQSRPDWTRLTARVREIDADFDRVEQLAKEDQQLSQQAASALADAEKAIREARAFRDQDITADVSAAESQLSQSQGSLRTQGYEEAIRLANAAGQSARDALRDATSRAQRRQQELESQRRAELASVPRDPQGQVLAEPLEWTPPADLQR
jgi:hypothetical protein